MNAVRLACIGLLPILCGTALAQSVRVVNEGGIANEWMLADHVELVAPGYPAAFAARGGSSCIAMGYRVNPDGTTSDFTLLRAWNDRTGTKEPEAGYWDAFARASAGALSQWRFQPRPQIVNPAKVDTVATLTFAGAQGTERLDSLRAKCSVTDLRAALERARQDHVRRGDMNLTGLDRNYRETTRNLAKPNQTRSGNNVD